MHRGRPHDPAPRMTAREYLKDSALMLQGFVLQRTEAARLRIDGKPVTTKIELTARGMARIRDMVVAAHDLIDEYCDTLTDQPADTSDMRQWQEWRRKIQRKFATL